MRRRWAGDVYKVIDALRVHRPDVVCLEVDTEPTGTTVILLPDPAASGLDDNYDQLVQEYVVPDRNRCPRRSSPAHARSTPRSCSRTRSGTSCVACATSRTATPDPGHGRQLTSQAWRQSEPDAARQPGKSGAIAGRTLLRQVAQHPVRCGGGLPVHPPGGPSIRPWSRG